MNNPAQTLALTIKSNFGKANVLACEIDVFEPTSKQVVKIGGIWDTGATGSVITTSVVNKLGLIPTGKTQVSTANGLVSQNTYIVNIGLPNGAQFGGVIVTEAAALNGGIEALIGMDIIGCGDFSITNHNNSTCMSFRTPSIHEIDYCKDPNIQVKHT